MLFKKTEMKIRDIDKFWKIVALTAKRNRLDKDFGDVYAPRIVCKDGFSVSVQAGMAMHSQPRENGLESYEEYELGWPSKRDKMLDKYADGWYEDSPEDWTRMTYAYVPKKVVNKLIRKHGGIVDVREKF